MPKQDVREADPVNGVQDRRGAKPIPVTTLDARLAVLHARFGAPLALLVAHSAHSEATPISTSAHTVR
ncbi:hypothetical protein OIE66_18240 [Nonomuraea sp. NBC_01738]|uniref:hypothetical protein n=1 Tax=Nonomuraea sp. NBC_01738 TaxID=2976003 RepID=UPI002E14102D|nr:hypothetical protein OIE66_18240 [Nonomuraea sp. NBC_01738]